MIDLNEAGDGMEQTAPVWAQELAVTIVDTG